MCEVLPAIDELSPSPDGENSKLEQLMISMLEERDRLMEKLREMQEVYGEATRKLNIVETDNNVIMRQLQALMPEVSLSVCLSVCLSVTKIHGINCCVNKHQVLCLYNIDGTYMYSVRVPCILYVEVYTQYTTLCFNSRGCLE